MISKLPRWVWAGGFILAAVAGMVNVVGLLGFEHQAVTHLTATTTRLSAAVAQGDASTLWPMAGLTASFIGGAALSGMLIESAALQPGRRYAAALLLESFLLASATLLLSRRCAGGMYLCCLACGLQNGMASTYSGAIVRTTHMTGIITDLGIALGHLLRRRRPDWRRALLLSVLLGGFAAGGFGGTLAWRAMGYRTLLIPAAITAVLALAYETTRRAGYLPTAVAPIPAPAPPR